MTMIEKVANAICKRRNDDDWPCNGLDFDMEMAKAAIEAMRDIDIKLMYILRDDGYDAMIDAALKEG